MFYCSGLWFRFREWVRDIVELSKIVLVINDVVGFLLRFSKRVMIVEIFGVVWSLVYKVLLVRFYRN